MPLLPILGEVVQTQTLIRQATGTSAAAATTVTATLGTGATAGNLIWCGVGMDKSSGTITPPSGFTTVISQDSASVSTYVGYKIAVGGETGISLTRATASTSGDTMWVSEWSDNFPGTWTILGSAWDLTNETLRTVTPSGTTSATTAQGYGLAFFTIDSGTSGAGTPTYTNSYVSIKGYVSTGRGEVAVAGLADIPVSTAATTTQTHTPTADQTSGVIVVFARVAAVVDSLIGAFIGPVPGSVPCALWPWLTVSRDVTALQPSASPPISTVVPVGRWLAIGSFAVFARQVADPVAAPGTPTPVIMLRADTSRPGPAFAALARSVADPIVTADSPRGSLTSWVIVPQMPLTRAVLLSVSTEASGASGHTAYGPQSLSVLPVAAQIIVLSVRDTTALQPSSNPASPLIGWMLWSTTARRSSLLRSIADPVNTDAPIIPDIITAGAIVYAAPVPWSRVSRDITPLQSSSNPAAPIIGWMPWSTTARRAVLGRSIADPVNTDTPVIVTIVTAGAIAYAAPVPRSRGSRDVTLLQPSSNPASPLIGRALWSATAPGAIQSRPVFDLSGIAPGTLPVIPSVIRLPDAVRIRLVRALTPVAIERLPLVLALMAARPGWPAARANLIRASLPFFILFEGEISGGRFAGPDVSGASRDSYLSSGQLAGPDIGGASRDSRLTGESNPGNMTGGRR